MSPEETPPPLEPAEVEFWLALLGDLTAEIVLIGGQALAFWAVRYADRFSSPARPVNSKDIDFCGEQDVAAAVARRLGGTLQLPDPDSHTPCTGLVRFTGQGGYLRQIDFLRQPYGLDHAEVLAEAVEVTLPAEVGHLLFKVMNPIHCLFSRISNVGGLPQYRTDHGLNQARIAVLCAREYVRERLDAGDAGDPDAGRAALDLNESIYRFAWGNRNALAVFRNHDIDAFEAVLVDDRLDVKFRTRRYPQMVKNLARRRRNTPASQ